MYFWNVVVEERDEGRNAAQLPRLRLHRVVHITQMLQISTGIRLENMVQLFIKERQGDLGPG